MMMGSTTNAVGGFTNDEMAELRRLRGVVQQNCVEESISMRDAVMYAARNELERSE